MPVILGGALDITALPGLLHQYRHGPTLGEPLPLKVPLTANHQDGHLTTAAHSYRKTKEETERWKEQ